MISRTFLMGLLIAVAISAYPLLAALMTVAGSPDTRLPSIVLRLGVGLLAIWVLIANRKSLRIYRPELLAAFLLFWAVYVFRIVDEGFLSLVTSPFNPVELLAMVVLFTLLPTMPLFIGLNPKSSAAGYQVYMVLGAITVLVLLFQSRDIALQMIDESRIRFAVEKLNPISVGYVGGTFMLMNAVGLFRPWRKPSVFWTGVFGVGMAAGLFTLVISASRGPAVATAVALLAYATIPPRFGRLMLTGVLAVVGGIAVYLMRGLILREFEIDVFARFIDAGDAYDASATSRQESFAGAWQQFTDNPIFGDSMFEKVTGSYPHNSVLESLMATGLVGGIAYLVCVVLMIVAALKLLAREDGYEWFALLAIFFLVGSQFSAAHYGNGAHWLTMVGVIVTEFKMRGVSVANRVRRQQAMAEAQAAADAHDARARNLVESELMKSDQPPDQAVNPNAQ